MPISYLRHLEVFSPAGFGDSIAVVGAGAVGSRVALSLAKLGVKKIRVFDHDKVESHNVPNQIYSQEQVGMSKVDALSEIIGGDAGIEIEAHEIRVEGKEISGDNVIFLLTDTMASRKMIWEQGIRMNIPSQLMVETRMGVDNGRVYSVNPCSTVQIEQWEKTLYSDERAQQSACGGSISVGPTADVLAGIAVWQFLKWAAIKAGKDEELENEIIYALRPFNFIVRTFREEA